MNRQNHIVLDHLCDVLKAWTAANGLPYVSANELEFFDGLTDDQRAWVGRFVALWDATEGEYTR